MEWVSCDYQLPPEGEVVLTKSGDQDPHERPLIRRGTLWYLPDMSMYVYYDPTHWKYRHTKKD
jgi:hypothetical protein